MVLQYFRDYLTGVQIQGYALLSTALNHVGHHQAVHVLLELAMQRFKEQENILGDRHNDWFELVFKIIGILSSLFLSRILLLCFPSGGGGGRGLDLALVCCSSDICLAIFLGLVVFNT